MIEGSLAELYFKWLCSLAFPNKRTRDSYSHVLYILYSTPFTYSIPLDENRLKDGLEMRWQFSCDCKIPYEIITNELEAYPCNVLEMLVALAQRLERNIMADLIYGDRISTWFATMFNNLGLFNYPDNKMDSVTYMEVKTILQIFMDRQYSHDGTNGNIIILHDSMYDLRTLEIWDQVCMYAENLLQKED